MNCSETLEVSLIFFSKHSKGVCVYLCMCTHPYKLMHTCENNSFTFVLSEISESRGNPFV